MKTKIIFGGKNGFFSAFGLVVAVAVIFLVVAGIFYFSFFREKESGVANVSNSIQSQSQSQEKNKRGDSLSIDDKKAHYLGILPLENPTMMMERFARVEKYLRQETGMNIKLKVYPTAGSLGGYSAVVRDVAEGNISFAYLAAATVVQANGNGPVVPFACAQKNGSPVYRGDLVVKTNSPYHTLEDLKGKNVTGSSMSSVSGALMPMAMLKQKGIDEKTFFNEGMKYVGSHDKAVEAVSVGIMDACFVNETTFNKHNKNGELRSIWKHDPVPEYPFTVNLEKVTPGELAKVKYALITMHKKDLEGIKASDAAYEKWVAIGWDDYIGIKNAIDEVYGPVFYDLDKWGKE